MTTLCRTVKKIIAAIGSGFSGESRYLRPRSRAVFRLNARCSVAVLTRTVTVAQQTSLLFDNLDIERQLLVACLQHASDRK